MRAASLPVLATVHEDGLRVRRSEQAALRAVLTHWAREGRLLRKTAQGLVPLNPLTVFEPLEDLAAGRLCLAQDTALRSCPDLRLAVIPLAHYLQASRRAQCGPDRGFTTSKGFKPQRGARATRLERLLNLTFTDQRWLERAARLVRRMCTDVEFAKTLEGVRLGMHSSARRYLESRVVDVRTWEPVLARARVNAGLLQRLADLDGFLDSELASSFAGA